MKFVCDRPLRTGLGGNLLIYVVPNFLLIYVFYPNITSRWVHCMFESVVLLQNYIVAEYENIGKV